MLDGISNINVIHINKIFLLITLNYESRLSNLIFPFVACDLPPKVNGESNNHPLTFTRRPDDIFWF